MFREFRDFAMRGNVVDLAVGVIIGAAFTSIVSSLVKDVLMPPVGFMMGGIDFANFFVTLSGQPADTLKAAQEAGAVTVNYGLFLNAVINFLIVSFAIFLVVRQMNRFRAKEDAAPPAGPSESEKILAEIRDLLKNGR
jgi:large conductance mechanosensitive channel